MLCALLVAGCPSSSDGDEDPGFSRSGEDAAGAGDTAGAPDAPDAPAPATAPFDWCAPDTPPDSACFAARRDPESELVYLARRIGDKLVATRDPTKLHWDWGEAVMLLGLVQLHRVTGDGRYRDFYRAFVDHHIDAGYDIWSSDSCAPAAVAVALLDGGEDDERYLGVIDDALRYLDEEALRTPEGGLNHLGTMDAFGVSLWADSLFMFGNVLTGFGEASGDAGPLDELSSQFGIFTELLQEDAGFYKHSAYSIFEQTDGVYWARANGWVAAAGYDHLRVRRNLGEALPAMESATAKLAAAVLASQDPGSGLWWTVPNRPGETYLETSASALFAFGLARGFRYGFLGDEVLPAVRSAIEGVVSRVRTGDDGWPVVTGTSGPTNVGTFEYYAGVPVEDDLSYGLGAVLLALTEASGLPGMDPTEGLTEVQIEPTAGFVARREQLLSNCLEASGKDKGSLYAQCCRIAAGESDLNDAQLEKTFAKLAAREDTSDFHAAALVRLLYLDDQTGALGESRRAQIRQVLLDFKYWLDEPGHDGMAYWTENHQILFHSAELLAGQRWPETAFSNSGMTGAEHVAHALPRIRRWLDLRGRFGFSEWHSNVYFNEDVPALLNLVDFAEDDDIRTRAAMVLDLVALDLLHNTYKGLFATTHGRTYPNHYQNGLTDSTRETSYVMLGLGEPLSPGNFSGAFLATSSYAAPEPLEALAEAVRETHEHRQRDSFDIAHGPAVGVGYEGLDDIAVWAGLMAIAAEEVIPGTAEVLTKYDLWDGFLFGSLPQSIVSLLKLMAESGTIAELSADLAPVARGMALESVSTYVYRTPRYQLAGAQDFKPGMWGPQAILWQATLDEQAFVLTTYPGGVVAALDDLEVEANDPWTGGWYPRATLHRNVGVVQYRRLPVAEGYQGLVAGSYTHAWLPKAGFDEVRTEGHWVLARKGDAWLGLWSHALPEWSAGTEQELRAVGEENVWIVELGGAGEQPGFDVFVEGLLAAEIQVGDTVRYASPSLGPVEVGWTGPMKVNGQAVDIGPYERWDNALQKQAYGSRRTLVTLGERTLDLDFGRGSRRVLAP